MRVMVMIKMNKDREPGKLPPKEAFEEMGKFNEQIAKAGILLDMGGLKPTAQGAKIKFLPGGKKTVIDGPFTETKELLVGYWVLQVKTMEEAIEWAKRAPLQHGPDDECEIEIRQFFEIEDFAPSDAIDRAVELGKELAKTKKQAQ